MIYRSALAAAAASLSFSPAEAADVSDFASGNGLYTACSSSDSYDQGRCMSFVEGFVYGGTAAWLEIGRRAQVPSTPGQLFSPMALYCPPDGVTIGQLKDVVAKGLADMPQARHLSSNVLVQIILQRAFPCKQG